MARAAAGYRSRGGAEFGEMVAARRIERGSD